MQRLSCSAVFAITLPLVLLIFDELNYKECPKEIERERRCVCVRVLKALVLLVVIVIRTAVNALL